MKPQPHSDGEEIIDHGKPWSKGRGRWLNRFKISTNPDRYEIASAHDCPYGQVGDVLWVRETVSRFSFGGCYAYKADNDPEDECTKWRPSIHMPFEACRLFLEITNIRVERLHDISKDDAVSEGIAKKEHDFLHNGWKDYLDSEYDTPYMNPVYSFRSLWSSINGAESWDANHWVWVLEFKQITKEEALS